MARYHPAAALIVVDLQNDFADPAGSLCVKGGGTLIPIDQPRDRRGARAAGALVVFTQDWHPSRTPHFAKDGGIVAGPLRRGHLGRRAPPGPRPGRERRAAGPQGRNGEDGYSGFTMRDPATGETIPTELEGLLRERGVDDVVVCGLATDYCVKATALDAAPARVRDGRADRRGARRRPRAGRRRARDRGDAAARACQPWQRRMR